MPPFDPASAGGGGVSGRGGGGKTARACSYTRPSLSRRSRKKIIKCVDWGGSSNLILVCIVWLNAGLRPGFGAETGFLRVILRLTYGFSGGVHLKTGLWAGFYRSGGALMENGFEVGFDAGVPVGCRCGGLGFRLYADGSGRCLGCGGGLPVGFVLAVVVRIGLGEGKRIDADFSAYCGEVAKRGISQNATGGVA